MRILGKAALILLLALFARHAAPAQETTASTPPSKIAKASTAKINTKKTDRALNSDDRLAVLASALDSKVPRFAEHRLLHLVHAIYERAGFPYSYASSDDLLNGVGKFTLVIPFFFYLLLWHGHEAVVVRPSKHVFYSFLHKGPGINDFKQPLLDQPWRTPLSCLRKELKRCGR